MFSHAKRLQLNNSINYRFQLTHSYERGRVFSTVPVLDMTTFHKYRNKNYIEKTEVRVKQRIITAAIYRK